MKTITITVEDEKEFEDVFSEVSTLLEIINKDSVGLTHD